MLKIGDKAPDFSLPASGGQVIRLSDYIGKQPVVVYFYPKDNTPGCTKEACAFRDAYEDFKAAGAEVIGISADTGDSHHDFAKQYQLPFILLSDLDGAVRSLYQVPKTLGLLPGRVTFVIDQEGRIRHQFNSQLNATRHVREALQALKS